MVARGRSRSPRGRGSGRGSGRGGGARATRGSAGRGCARTATDRGSGRPARTATGRGAGRGSADRGSSRASSRGSGRGAARGSGRGSGRGAARASSRGSGRGAARGSGPISMKAYLKPLWEEPRWVFTHLRWPPPAGPFGFYYPKEFFKAFMTRQQFDGFMQWHKDEGLCWIVIDRRGEPELRPRMYYVVSKRIVQDAHRFYCEPLV